MSADLDPLRIRDFPMYDPTLSLPSTPKRKVHEVELPLENQVNGVIGSVSAVFQGVMEEAAKSVFPSPERTSPLKRRLFSLSGGVPHFDSSAAKDVPMEPALDLSANQILPGAPLFQDFEGQRAEVDSKRSRCVLSPPQSSISKKSCSFKDVAFKITFSRSGISFGSI